MLTNLFTLHSSALAPHKLPFLVPRLNTSGGGKENSWKALIPDYMYQQNVINVLKYVFFMFVFFMTRILLLQLSIPKKRFIGDDFKWFEKPILFKISCAGFFELF